MESIRVHGKVKASRSPYSRTVAVVEGRVMAAERDGEWWAVEGGFVAACDAQPVGAPSAPCLLGISDMARRISAAYGYTITRQAMAARMETRLFRSTCEVLHTSAGRLVESEQFDLYVELAR